MSTTAAALPSDLEPGWSGDEPSPWGPCYRRYEPGQGMVRVVARAEQTYAWFLSARARPEALSWARDGFAGPFDAMVITNGAFKLMREWADGPLVREYSLSSDWDDRWRTGGSVAEVIEEAHLDEAHILAALERFAAERGERRRRLRELLDDGG